MAPRSTGRTTPIGWRWRWISFAPTVLAALAVSVSGYRGADYPGQIFRAELWQHAPFGTWNFRWYGGHSTLAYSFLTPPLAALIGAFGVAVASTVIAMGFASGLSRHWSTPVARFGSMFAFALATSLNLVVGRVSFALGLAIAVGVMWAWDRQRRRWAILAAPTVGLASPVAAVLLGAVVLAVLITRWSEPPHPAPVATAAGHRRPNVLLLLLLGVATALPIVVIGLLSLRGPLGAGEFPYRTRDLIGTTVVLVALFVASAGSDQRDRLVRVGATVGLVANIVFAAVPNPLGANFVRFTSMIAVPVGIGYFLDRDRTQTKEIAGSPDRWSRPAPDRSRLAALVFGVVTAVAWAQFGWRELSNYRAWRADPSRDAEFFGPLLDAVAAQPAPFGRVEIPFTRLHMETSVVASEFALARGWERQLDRARNPELYAPELTAEEYRAWLVDNGVGYLAVPTNPQVRIDFGGVSEMEVIEQILVGSPSVAWLEPVWSSDDWALYRVDTKSDGPALSIGWKSLEFAAESVGPIALSAAYDPRLGITPAGCLRAGEDGRIVAEVPEPGRYRIIERRWGLLTGSVPCRP